MLELYVGRLTQTLENERTSRAKPIVDGNYIGDPGSYAREVGIVRGLDSALSAIKATYDNLHKEDEA